MRNLVVCNIPRGVYVMVKSMTAYGRSTGLADGKKITVEVKSVNSKFFDPSIKISRNYSYLEEKAKAILQKYISRGKIDLYIGIEAVENQSCDICAELAYAGSYITALKKLRDEFSLVDDITVMKVASNRDIFVVTRSEEDSEKVFESVLPFLTEALESFSAMRISEGENLCRDITEKRRNIEKITSMISSQSERMVEEYSEKLRARIKKLLDSFNVEIDEQRILTESAIFADRVAVDEELVRLSSHFSAFDEIILSDGPVGRKLDFLIQEMNREANTIGSKCSDSDIAHMVVDIKCELEKIREQVQNIE